MTKEDIDELMTATAGVVRSYVDQAIKPLLADIAEIKARPVRDGKDGRDGKDAEVSLEQLKPVLADWEAKTFFNARDVAGLVERVNALEARKPEKGEKGNPGEKGEPAVIELADVIDALMPEVAKWLEENKPANGRDGRDGVDGKTVTIDDVKPLIEEFISREIAALPKAKDGVGVAGAVIDREGKLVLTLTDGATKDLGVVVGRDGTNGKDGDKGEPGRDGFGLEDFVIEQDERNVTLKFQRGDVVKEFSIKIDSMIDRGVWTERAYEKGDVCTWGGSAWVAQRATRAKPETNDDWRLMVRRGRDGKPGKDGDRGPEGKKGEKGDPGPRGFTV